MIQPFYKLMSALVIAALSMPICALATITVPAKLESQPFLETESDADADDPAIWVHPTDHAKSLVIGTLKNGGLVVLNLNGQTIQRIPAPAAPTADDEPGRFNNVDLLLGFQIQGLSADLAVVTDRGRDKLVIYKINPQWSGSIAPLANVTAQNIPWVFSATQSTVNNQRTAYGLATQKLSSGVAIGFVTQREQARIAKVKFSAVTGGKVTYSVTNNYSFPSMFTLPNGQSWTPCADEDNVQPQFEGMVIDKDDGKLYAAQETVGIWRMNLDGSARKLVEKVRSYGVNYIRTWDADEEEYACQFTSDPGYGGKRITADAEGLTIYYVPTEKDERYLIGSSQGDNTFSIWDIDENQWEYEGTFATTLGTDLNEESDGAHVVSVKLGSAYPLGLLVTQDANNTPHILGPDGEVVANTNFKFTPFDRVIKALDLDL